MLAQIRPRDLSVDLGHGLIEVYLMLINAIVQIVGAIRSRSHNPGQVTAVILFMPSAVILGGEFRVLERQRRSTTLSAIPLGLPARHEVRKQFEIVPGDCARLPARRQSYG
jgi:hypothetical protein